MRCRYPIVCLVAALQTGAEASGAAAADGALPRYISEPGLKGRMVAVSNRATDPLMAAWASGFARCQPEVDVELRTGTRVSTDAFDAAIAAVDVDLIPAAREPVPSEMSRLTVKLGAAPLIVAVATGSHSTKSATHALAVYVNAQNPITRISLDQLRQIYGPGERITRWGQLGLGGEWADRPVTPFSVPITDPNGNPLGITNYLHARLFGARPGMRRSLYQVDSTGPGLHRHMLTNIVARVAAEPTAIGFSGFGFAAPGVKALAVAETDAGPWYAGTRDDVLSRRYPLTRSIYIVAHARADRPVRPEVSAFLRYVLSRDGQSIFAQTAGGYLPLTPALAAEGRARLAQPSAAPRQLARNQNKNIEEEGTNEPCSTAA